MKPAQKTELRKKIRTALKQMTAEQRSAASLQARALLEKQTIWREAKAILFYAPMPEEIDVWPLLVDALAAGKKVFLPRFDANTAQYLVYEVKHAENDIRVGQFGIREPLAACAPIELNRLDLILVPGVGFDWNGRRLGRGKGHYDRLLTSIKSPTCGVAFDIQMLDEIPVEPHDVHLNYILTPTRWHPATERARS